MHWTDGRLSAHGVVVMTYVERRLPETEADWRRVADTLRRLHRLTQGGHSALARDRLSDLLHAETGTKIDLGAMRLPRACVDAEQRGHG